jgi:hypothetical protein
VPAAAGLSALIALALARTGLLGLD